MIRRKTILSIRVFTLGGILFILSCSTKRKNVTIITHVNVFDGEKLVENTNLVFNDSVIIKITNDIGNYEADSLIDGTNKTILPPLLNAHVHVQGPENLKEAQKHGIFALLDMHSTDDHANRLRTYNDSLHFALYYSAGAGATVPGGHGTEYGIPFPTINDTVSPVKFTEDRIKNGADYIKILHEPFFTQCISLFQTKLVIQTAHRYNKLCVAHISVLSDALVLSLQQIDGFMHIWVSGKATEKSLKVMARKRIFIVPTLYVINKARGLFEKLPVKRPILSFEDIKNEVKKAYDANIPILAGTDAPNFNFNYSTHLFKEMELLSECGIPNIEVLKAATTNISRCFKLKEFGKLEQGRHASFILVNGRPDRNLKDLYKHKTVWKKGKVI